MVAAHRIKARALLIISGVFVGGTILHVYAMLAYARRLLIANDCNETIRSKIKLIRNASDEIEAVVASIQELNPDSRSEEVGKSQIRMLDLSTALKNKIELLDKKTPVANESIKD